VFIHKRWPTSGAHLRAGLQPKRNALLRNGIVMVKVTVKGGTPEGCESLCRSCAQGHIITGFRASEEEVYCRTFYIEREMHFPVRACTFYQDKRLATKTEMEEIAWHLRSTNGKPTRNLGFVRPNSVSTEPDPAPAVSSQ
jgi:hypothetical protein